MTDQLAYPCSLCDDTFETQAELYAHISIKHPSDPRPTDREPPPGRPPWKRRK